MKTTMGARPARRVSEPCHENNHFCPHADGVSLVTTYRSTSADMIRKEGIEPLIAGMAKSNRQPPGDRGGTPEPAGSPRKDAAP